MKRLCFLYNLIRISSFSVLHYFFPPYVSFGICQLSGFQILFNLKIAILENMNKTFWCHTCILLMFSVYLYSFCSSRCCCPKVCRHLSTMCDTLLFHTVDVCDSLTISMSAALQHFKLFVHLVSFFLIHPFLIVWGCCFSFSIVLQQQFFYLFAYYVWWNDRTQSYFLLALGS